MSYHKLELHISQVERAIAKSRKKFRSTRKSEIYQNLVLLFEKVKKSDYKVFNKELITVSRLALDLVFHGVMHLDYKSEGDIPKHLIHCLEKVLDDWIPGGTSNYFIVISHNKSPDQFWIRALDEEQLQQYNLYFNILFSISYKQSLIQINKPLFLFDNYLASVPVYHEMGHFIEKNYQLVKNLFRNDDSLKTKSELHYAEHFSDIFAAQYIGKCSIEPLTYMSPDDNKVTHTHPSNTRRIDVVNAFLTGSGSREAIEIIDNLKKITLERTGQELKIRSEALRSNPFETFKPIRITSPSQLHTLFSLGWNSWMSDNSAIRQKYPQSAQQCCDAINKIIKDSIDLYMPLQPWMAGGLSAVPSNILARVKRYKDVLAV